MRTRNVLNSGIRNVVTTSDAFLCAYIYMHWNIQHALKCQ